jgi:prepilin-type N-terminal cleavage/methylation domain-containing protein
MSKRSKAFTLIEMLIATAMISVISITLFYFALSTTRLISRASDLAKSMQSVRFIACRISSDIMQSGGAGIGSNPSKLIIGNITYEFRDGKVRREEGSDVYYLTIEGEIKGLKFFYPSSKLIGVEITPKTGKAYYYNVCARN